MYAGEQEADSDGTHLQRQVWEVILQVLVHLQRMEHWLVGAGHPRSWPLDRANTRWLMPAARGDKEPCEAKGPHRLGLGHLQASRLGQRHLVGVFHPVGGKGRQGGGQVSRGTVAERRRAAPFQRCCRALGARRRGQTALCSARRASIILHTDPRVCGVPLSPFCDLLLVFRGVFVHPGLGAARCGLQCLETAET